jgi:hypothetical protein
MTMTSFNYRHVAALARHGNQPGDFVKNQSLNRSTAETYWRQAAVVDAAFFVQLS